MEQIKMKAPAVASEKLWEPKEASFTTALGSYLVKSGQLDSLETFRRVGDEAARVLGQCLKPGPLDAQRTGLVIGYVQSGKTMSMTAVSALARDNRFRIVIVISGTTDILHDQSAGRFERDLRQSMPGGAPPWLMWRNPTTAHHGQELSRCVGEWRSADIPEDQQQPIFITVMKNHAHLRSLEGLLASVDLRGIDTLIVDDEADAASLNTRPNAPTPSTTYARLRDIRARLPKHTYLQYTATAQSLILISLLDMLSPNFADTLKAGEDYTGGRDFFDGTRDLIVSIPNRDLPAQVSGGIEPPPSLLNAMRFFFLAAAASPKKDNDSLRSMLVHPDRLKGVQNPYFDWVSAIKNQWADVLRRKPDDPERVALVQTFEPEYADLQRTAGPLPSLADLLRSVAIGVGRTQVWRVNTDGSEVNWENGTLHILVGGQKLDRGYTVKGLIVTYMPRGPGTWTADTIQQRARFFGYKRSYLRFCRVFLQDDLIDAYEDYVAHEESLREHVQKHRGHSTRQLRRAFVLDPSLVPTRKNVVTEPFFRTRTGNAWFKQSSPHVVADVPGNFGRLESFRNQLSFTAHPQFGQHKLATGVPLEQVLEFLGEHAIAPNETLDLQVVIFHLLRIQKDQPGTGVTVLKMNAGDRSVRDDDGDTIELHAGRSATTGAGAHADIFDSDHITLQTYCVKVLDRSRNVLADNVAAIAIRIPSSFGRISWLVQPKAQQQ
jgi:hypothetical protein